MNEEKKLVWKYFIQQKLIEVGLTILIIFGLTVVPYLLGHYIGDNNSIWCDHPSNSIPSSCGLIDQYLEGIAYLGITAAILSMIYLIVYPMLINWILSNWKKAKTRAKRQIELKKLKGGKKK